MPKRVLGGLAAAIIAVSLLVAGHGADAVAGPDLAGYPNAANTGIPSGRPALKAVPSQVSSGLGWHWDSRGWIVVDGANAVLKGLSVTGAIEVYAAHTTIEYSSVTNSGEGWDVGIRPGASDTFVYRNNLQGTCNRCDDRLTYGVAGFLGGDDRGLEVARNNFANIDHPLQQEGGLIRGNYVHDLATKPADTDHVDSFFSGGGESEQLTIRHNTLLTDTPYDGATAAIMLNNAFGTQSNRLIENNLLGGGGFVFYGGDDNKGHPASNVIFRNNQITTAYDAKGGYYGVYAYTGGDTISGNTWHDGPNAGQPVNS